MTFQFRQAAASDLEGVAQVFAAAFPESIAHYFSRPPSMAVVAEPFALCLAAEPDGFFVAVSPEGRIAGYIFAPCRTGRLPWAALRRGFAFRWLWGWVSGRFGIGLNPVRALAVNKVDFLRSARQPTVKAEARILSIAVHPDFQGQGLATKLARLGIERLDRLGVPLVRLEVRPDNAPAVRLYTGLGFRPHSTTRDSQGEWLIMLREPPGR